MTEIRRRDGVGEGVDALDVAEDDASEFVGDVFILLSQLCRKIDVFIFYQFYHKLLKITFFKLLSLLFALFDSLTILKCS